ncbi:N-acetylglucosaminyldiphosphoundecaprenol N-acetyl-beta-D-mannosaminyltransferase [Nocardioides ginsengisegetis]|uniref:N-acetylglucosaminyldiphosphoundecaprenol N-acetyl-beta-D-mannosaminyltransferase n=1 Tax=Nocardioides ginsengisegetis TaxID=661491 RepID=A0A7W3PAL5_9ACTN|nr:WecB/TagA/CpsF family glycosyltransferase [Nocardioides ginsengisegetis]MBA8804626.1 N-acetylglucosaminyldiphosphoundecaprenol N-acetyl-beta-D-mannosaminyltransferase [Nocardioides ginsengisegetis]
MTDTLPPRLLFGLEVDPVTLPEVVAMAEEAISTRRRLLIGVVNAAKVAKLKADQVLRDSLLECDVLLADGQSVVWASRILRRPLPERVTGIDLFESLLALADRQRLRVYLLGATPAVLSRVEQEIATRYPGAVVAGSCDGYYRPEEAAWVALAIAGAHPDMLFLGMTTPRKEIFLARYGDQLDVPVLHGVGGSFDVLAGVTRRAPLAWQRHGLEWAYRVLQEPRRLWRRYLVTNSAFLVLVAAELLHPRRAYPRPLRPGTPHHHRRAS